TRRMKIRKRSEGSSGAAGFVGCRQQRANLRAKEFIVAALFANQTFPFVRFEIDRKLENLVQALPLFGRHRAKLGRLGRGGRVLPAQSAEEPRPNQAPFAR